MPTFQFAQVNVFSADPLGGNPLAVVHAAEGLSEAQMAALARWTNLSETTFLLPPTDPDADYYVRIFTPGVELPFAGHPTLGSCHAWLSVGGKPRRPDIVMQQCGVGLVPVRCDGPRLEFAAPPMLYQALVRNLGKLGIPSDHVKVLLRESGAENWGVRGGVPASEVDLGFKVNI